MGQNGRYCKQGGEIDQKYHFILKFVFLEYFVFLSFEVSRDHGEQKKWGFARICSF